VNTDDHGDEPLLEVADLRTSFVTEEDVLPAVDGVSLGIPRGRTVALVGESGCGKSVTALSIMRLIPQPPGRIVGGRVLLYPSAKEGPSSGEPIDLLSLSEEEMGEVRGKRIAMIFQEPMASLNPVFSIGEQIAEAIELYQSLRGGAAWSSAVEMLRRVGIASPKQRACDYPHQLSGGMCQRVMIAMALACQPALLIADEPTTALDVTVQLQILALLGSLQVESGMSVLIITHDLGVVAHTADYVYVMYAGRIVEHTTAANLFRCPLHPYTQGLLRCLPRLSQPRDRLEAIPGVVPDPRRYPPGCRFHPRCRLRADRVLRPGGEPVNERLRQTESELELGAQKREDTCSAIPELRELRPGHFVACWEVIGNTGNPHDHSLQHCHAGPVQ
jgi:oligopeptide/dipeptide ABC transporter ATP-binding protein